jgi:uncharacterized cupin superfamily protein
MILRKGAVAPETATTNNPAPYALPDGLVRWLPLSDAGRLTQFGAAVETLDPGGISSQRHWHEAEDEFLYVLEGEVTVVENDGDHVLAPGDAACWPAGEPNAHQLINRSQRPVTYLIVGTRAKDDAAHYPDIDLHYSRKDGWRSMSRKDGTPYPGWPKETNR